MVGRVGDMRNEIGKKLARKLFERRGNHSEMHLSEAELAEIIQAAVEWADKTAIEFLTQTRGIPPGVR